MLRKQRGFTLIELLIVVAIIGIIAAIAIPNLMSAIQRAYQKKAMGEIRGLATALASYSTDSSNYPPANTSYTDTGAVPVIATELAPYYIKQIPNPDSWGSQYQYAVTANGQDFAIRSVGRDLFGETAAFPGILLVTVLHTRCFENDLVWVNQDFVILPDGRQSKCS